MALKYLMDENVTPIYATQLRRKRPDLVVWAVGEIGTPPKSTLDPEILVWCEEHNLLYFGDKQSQVNARTFGRSSGSRWSYSRDFRFESGFKYWAKY
jgi:hypothetical protein